MSELETTVAVHGERLDAQGREIRELKENRDKTFTKLDEATITLTKTNTKLDNLLKYPPICKGRMDQNAKDIQLLRIAVVAIIVIIFAMGTFIGFNIAGMVPPVWSITLTTFTGSIGGILI